MAAVTAQGSSPEKMKLISCKAGMENVDIEKINEIISDVSKGSNFYAHKQESQQVLLKKIEDMKCLLSKATEQQKQASLAKMDKLVAELEARRDLSHVIVHIDMDAFYAAVETRDNPDLANIPMAVGGTSMLSTSNYHARKFGVRAAMPGFIAKKLCPELKIVRPNFRKYAEVSDEVKEVFAQYDSNFGSMSLDEASLDITDLVEQGLLQDDSRARDEIAENIVREIRQKVILKTSLTCSAGISVNMRLAKVCSDMNKPNGQFCLPFTRDKIMEFANKLPIGKVCGIGRVTEQQLNALDVKTCGDLHMQRANLGLLFSEISLEAFMKMSLGLGSIQVSSEDPRKSMSVERTFRDMWDPEQLKMKCEELCILLSQDLKKENVVGKTVAIKIKTVKFNVKTRAKSLLQYTSSCNVITSAARWLLEQEIKATAPEPLKLRLMGVKMSSLLDKHEAPSKHQMTLEDVLKNCPKLKNESEDTTYSCPIYAEEKSSRSKITKHINQCLETPEELAANGEEDVGNSEGSTFSHKTSSDETCPVCNKKQNYNDNEAFNRHIDECLSGRKVREILKEEMTIKEKKPEGGSTKKKLIPNAKWTPNKRRKVKSCNSKTIDTFFKS